MKPPIWTIRQSIFASPAQYKLCQFYAAGKGVPQDYAQAKEWCKKSEVGFAYVVLGRMAERGLGGDKDLREALDQYRKAAILGVPDGYVETARLDLASGSHDGEKKLISGTLSLPSTNFLAPPKD